MCILIGKKTNVRIYTIVLATILVVDSFKGEHHEKMAYSIDFTSFTLM